MARATKVYRVISGNGLFPHVIANRLRQHGLPVHIQQGETLIAATTKSEAAVILGRVTKSEVKPTHLSEAMGNRVDMLVGAGALPDGTVLAFHRGVANDPILRFTPTSFELYGRWRYDNKTGIYLEPMLPVRTLMTEEQIRARIAAVRAKKKQTVTDHVVVSTLMWVLGEDPFAEEV